MRKVLSKIVSQSDMSTEAGYVKHSNVDEKYRWSNRQSDVKGISITEMDVSEDRRKGRQGAGKVPYE